MRGERGWFPSKFVRLIDERNGKVYSVAGDDSVTPAIGELVRSEFTLALKCVLEHGLKRHSMLDASSHHPWRFVEEAARKCVEKDFESVYSRLVLCKTFRLDEDGKVLTPDELLFRSVQLVNLSHKASGRAATRANLTAKLAALVCIGLNEQCLHIWLETLCSSVTAVEKWYEANSFMRSPGWVQIKCELRILAQFSFLLATDSPEAAASNLLQLSSSATHNNVPDINECIKDMLVKYHLFSWEI